MDSRHLADISEIHKLKARYFRLMDTKQWDEFRDVFTDDLKFYIENSPVPQSNQPTFPSADALVSYLAASHPGKVTVHQGHMPEIDFLDDDTATGVWAMFDWVDDPGRGKAWQGFGHYHEHYVRCPDGRWRICEVHLTRLRVDDVTPRPSGSEPGIDPEQMRRAAAGPTT
jgi:SnoaL-like domain